MVGPYRGLMKTEQKRGTPDRSADDKVRVSIVEDEHHRDKADYERNNVFSDIRASNLLAPGGRRASSSTRCADVQAISQS